MKRYEPYIEMVNWNNDHEASMRESESGDFVEYSDVLKLINKNEGLKSKIKRMQKDLDDWENDCGV